MPTPPQTIRTDSRSATFDADGRAEIAFDPVQQDKSQLVQRIAVSSTSSAATEARVYLDREGVDRLVDGTTAGNLDVADMLQPIVVPGGGRLVVVWTNGTAAAVATANVQYAEVNAGAEVA